MQTNMLNLFNKILENNGVATIWGQVQILNYTTGNKYVIEDIYNNFYKFHDGKNKYYIEYSDGTEIECDTLNTLLFYSTTTE